MDKGTKQGTSGSLMDFTFDDENTFFGINDAEGSKEDVIKEVKSGIDDEDEEESRPQGTKIDDRKAENKVKATKEVGKSKSKPKEEEEDDDEDTEEDEEDDEEFFKDTDEEEKDIEEEEEGDKNKKKEKVKKEEGKKKEGKEEDKKETDEESDEEFFTSLAKDLKERGIFQNVEIGDDEKLDEEKFFQKHDEEIESRVDETIEDFFTGMDDDAKAFIQFKKNGGATSDFFAVYQSNSQIDFDKVDLEEEKDREAIIRMYIAKNEKLTAEEMNDKLRWIKEGGKEKSKATKYLEVLKEQDKQEKEALLKASEKKTEEREERLNLFNTALNKVLGTTESVGIIPITKVDQKELFSYMTKPNVKIGKNYLPKFQVDLSEILRAETDDAKKKLIALSKIVKNNFDMSDLLTKTQTVVTKRAKSGLKAAKEGSVRGKVSGGYSKKSLSDFFPE